MSGIAQVLQNRKASPNFKSRREFLGASARLLAGAAVGGGILGVMGCDSGVLLDPTGRKALHYGSQGFFPENMSAWNGYGNDNTNALKQALAAAGAVHGLVYLNAGETYIFNSDDLIIPDWTTVKTFQATGLAILKSTAFWSNGTRNYSIGMSDYSIIERVIVWGPGDNGQNGLIGDSGIDSGTSDNWSVLGCTIKHWPLSGINSGTGASGCTVRNNRIENNLNAGVQVAVGVQGWTIDDNVIFNNGRNGIDCNGSYCEITGNTIVSNGWWGNASSSSDRNGIYLAVGPNSSPAGVENIILGNEVRENYADGIKVGGKIQNTVIESNDCSDNRGSGIVVDGSAYIPVNTHLSDNIASHNGYNPNGSVSSELYGFGFAQVDDLSGCWIQNCTFENNRTQDMLYNSDCTLSGNTCSDSTC